MLLKDFEKLCNDAKLRGLKTFLQFAEHYLVSDRTYAPQFAFSAVADNRCSYCGTMHRPMHSRYEQAQFFYE